MLVHMCKFFYFNYLLFRKLRGKMKEKVFFYAYLVELQKYFKFCYAIDGSKMSCFGQIIEFMHFLKC